MASLRLPEDPRLDNMILLNEYILMCRKTLRSASGTPDLAKIYTNPKLTKKHKGVLPLVHSPPPE